MADAVLRLEKFMDTALGDPIVRLVMQRDGVTDSDVWQLMKQQQRQWFRRRSAAA